MRLLWEMGTPQSSGFAPFIGGLVGEGQIQTEAAISTQDKCEQDDKPQHEDNPRESQEKVLNEKGNLHGMLLSLGIQVGAVHDVGEQQHLDEECSRDSSDGSGCGRQGEQVEQENAGVGGADAVVDPHTVVVEAMHTRPADTAVLGPGWLLHGARGTHEASLKQHPIIGINLNQ